MYNYVKKKAVHKRHMIFLFNAKEKAKTQVGLLILACALTGKVRKLLKVHNKMLQSASRASDFFQDWWTELTHGAKKLRVIF